MKADDLRALIAKHESGLLSARSPRQRLAHLFRLVLYRQALADAPNA